MNFWREKKNDFLRLFFFLLTFLLCCLWIFLLIWSCQVAVALAAGPARNQTLQEDEISYFSFLSKRPAIIRKWELRCSWYPTSSSSSCFFYIISFSIDISSPTVFHFSGKLKCRRGLYTRIRIHFSLFLNWMRGKGKQNVGHTDG